MAFLTYNHELATLEAPDQILDLYDRCRDLCAQDNPQQALTDVLELFGLHLEPHSRKAINLMLSEAVKVKRFTGNPHLSDDLRGNVAQHTMQVMVVIGRLIVGAFPELYFDKDGQDPFGTAYKNPITIPHETRKNLSQIVGDIFVDLMAQTLMHDFGEIFIEFSSLSQRRIAGLKQELPGFERKFCEFAMRLAYKTDAQTFSRVINHVRDGIKNYADEQAALEEDIVGQTIAEKIDELIAPYRDQYDLEYLPAHKLAALRYFLAAYDEPEGHSHFAQFNGSVVKNAQNMQTVLHMVECVGAQGAVPYETANSSEVVGTLWYTERGLRRVYDYARNPIFKRIARESALLSYETNYKLTTLLPIPMVIDRQAKMKQQLGNDTDSDNIARAESAPDDYTNRLDEIRQAGRRLCGQHGIDFSKVDSTVSVHQAFHEAVAQVPHNDFSTAELSKPQLERVYRAAWEKARKSKTFEPPQQAIIHTREKLPRGITGKPTDQAPVMQTHDKHVLYRRRQHWLT